MGNISLTTLFAYGISVIILLIIITALRAPVKIIIKVMFNFVIGILALIIINFVGNYINIHLPINIYTILATGFLGIPGIVVIYVLTIIFL